MFNITRRFLDMISSIVKFTSTNSLMDGLITRWESAFFTF